MDIDEFLTYNELTEVRSLMTILNEAEFAEIRVRAVLTDSNGDELGELYQHPSMSYVYAPRGGEEE